MAIAFTMDTAPYTFGYYCHQNPPRIERFIASYGACLSNQISNERIAWPK